MSGSEDEKAAKLKELEKGFDTSKINGSKLTLENTDGGSPWERLLRTGELSDLTVKVSGETFKLHRLVLQTQAPHFLTRLLAKDENAKEVKLEGVRAALFRNLVNFVYSGRTQLEAKDIMQLMSVADAYGVDYLRSLCAKAFATTLTPATAGAYFATAKENFIFDMYDQCFKYVLENAGECFAEDSFLKSVEQKDMIAVLKHDWAAASEIDLFHGVVRWGKLRVKPKKAPKAKDLSDGVWDEKELLEAIKDMMPHVRFALMSPSDIMDVVAPTGLVSEEIMFEAVTQQLATVKPPRLTPVRPRIMKEQMTARGGTKSGTWGYSGPADLLHLTVNKRVTLLAIGAHVPAGRTTWELGVWRGTTRVGRGNHEANETAELKDPIKLKLEKPVVLDAGVQYTIGYLQRGPNTPQLRSCQRDVKKDGGFEFQFRTVSNFTPTGWTNNGTSEGAGQIPCIWWKS